MLKGVQLQGTEHSVIPLRSEQGPRRWPDYRACCSHMTAAAEACTVKLRDATMGNVLSDLRCPVRRRQPLGVLGRRDAVQQQRLHPPRIPACGAASGRAHHRQRSHSQQLLTGCSITALPQWSPVQPLYAAARELTASCTAARTPGGSLASACNQPARVSALEGRTSDESCISRRQRCKCNKPGRCRGTTCHAAGPAVLQRS